MAAENPTMYRHPSPSGTNPHWQTEIESGPHLVSRGRKKTNTSDTRRRPRTSMTQQSNGSNGPSSLDLSSSDGSRDGQDGRNDSKFDFKQYQREDEEMWGIPSMERLTSSSSWQSSGITRPPRARVRGSDAEICYANYKNPQINELHPATVTKLNSREEARWIFQPLPNADVMKGRERAPRSRSDSGDSSRLSARSPVLSSRDVSHRIIEQKLKIGEESLSSSLSRGSSFRTPNYISLPQHDRTMMEGRDFAQVDDSLAKNEKIQTSPIQVRVSDHSEESAVTVVHSPDMAPEPLRKQQTRRVASKPQLSTIVSNSIVPSDEDGSRSLRERPKENSNPSLRHSDNSISGRDRISRRSALLAKDDSLKVLRDLAPSSAIFNTQVVSTDDLVKASKKSSRLPSQASEDGKPDFNLEIFESWNSADFELPKWIHEHTKREVKERWSMDI